MKKIIYTSFFLFFHCNILGQNFWTQSSSTRVDIMKISPNGYIFTGSLHYGIQLSSDKGQTWNQTSFANLGERFESINDSILIVGSGDIYVSYDFGSTFFCYR